MSTKPNTYTPELVASLRASVSKCTNISDALDVLVDRLGLNRDHTRRTNKRYGIWPHPLTPFSRTPSLVCPAKGRKIKRLFWDIEVSPNICTVWKTGYKINVPDDNIVKERAIICIGYKWQGESKVHILHWDDHQSDKALLEAFLPVIAQADESVYHKGDSFDLPWVKTRCLFHGLPPIPDHRAIDTLTLCRRKFYFNSNRLDYIARFLGLGKKIHTDFNLWKDIVLNKCPKALIKMCLYCQHDVVLLEKVFDKVSLFFPAKTHVGVLNGGDKWSCPRDGSTNVRVTKTRVTASGIKHYQMQCKDCGGYYSISEAAHTAYLESKEKPRA